MANKNLRYKIAPGAFCDPSSPTYLGNPDVVSSLVGKFCADVEALLVRLSSRDVVLSDAKVELHGLVTKIADIFAGRSVEYDPIKGYNGISLDGKVVALLGPYWSSQRAEYADDPMSVFFDWLSAIFTEKWRLADGDDMLLGVMIKPSLQSANRILLGIENV